MIGTVGAIVASAVIGGAVSLVGAGMQADASNKAAQAQVDAADKNIAYQKEVDAQRREDSRPWREAGAKALADLQAGIEAGTFSMEGWEFEKDPGYDFRLKQGTKALERSAAARGNLFSGALGKALTEYNQDFASNEYDRAYARAAGEKKTNYNILAGMAGTGQQQVNTDAGFNQQGANVIIGQQSNAGNALAQGYLGQGQAWGNGLNNLGGALNTGIENYLLWQHLG